MNNVMLTGRIGTDIEASKVNDTTLAKFRLAVPVRGKKDEAEFFSVVVWGKQAEACIKHLGKGRRVAIQGRLHQNSWEVEREGQDPAKRERVEVVASEVEFLDRKPTAAEAPAVAEPVLDQTPIVPVSPALDELPNVWNPAAAGEFQLFSPA